MSLFISHRTADNALASKVGNFLVSRYGIDCYIDDIDSELRKKKGKAELTPVLVSRLRECTHLLAIVTHNTQGSWWVPFEIGVAREMPRAIACYTNLTEDGVYPGLPEYLLEWPRLRTDRHLDEFAREYKKHRLTLSTESFPTLGKTAGEALLFENARAFEADLMDSLNQRRF